MSDETYSKTCFVNLHGVCEIIDTVVSNIFSRNYLLQSDTRHSLLELFTNRANGTAKIFALGSFGKLIIGKH